MSSSRRRFLKAVPSYGSLPWLPQSLLGAGAAFPGGPPSRALFPLPANGATAAQNPPGFGWWRARGASTYRLLVRDAQAKVVYEAAGLKDPVHLPDRVFPPGEYRWDVEACDARGAVLASRGAWPFRVLAGAPELPWQDPRALLARVPDGHPRLIFPRDRLTELRKSTAAGRRRAWEALRKTADRALKVPLPKPPRYDTFEGKERQRMGYVTYFRSFRKHIDEAMSPLALAYVFSGDERYGLAAKKIFMEVASWGVEGPMSVSSPFGDEPGLSMSRHGQRAYDWLHDLFDERERAQARAATAARARQILARLRKSDYLARPEESHAGRLIAYLSEYAIVLKDEAPDAAEWLDYSLRGLMTFYPHWGDEDGGWAEGVSYALAYNTIYLGALESLRAAAGLDLYRRPFFGKVRRFFLYCASPVGEVKPFGDGAERGGPAGGGAILMRHHARRFRDAHALWWAEQAGGRSQDAADGLVSMLTEDDLRPEPPSTLPSASVFRGIGWAALHSALDRPREDTFFLFKSSPFGSVSHSHADQNSFCILKGGRALAIASGYYGPAYGQPHHALWTRQTKANNCILVNGEGQIARDAGASGRITAFRHRQALTYVCGDAAAAYGGKLKTFLRHVLFLRPGLILTLDEVAAPQPSRFEWLLHALDEMQADGKAGTVNAARDGSSLAVHLACDDGLSFGLTDSFDTPYNEGMPPEYRETKPNQWHFKAATGRDSTWTRIAAAMVVRGPGEDFRTEWKQSAGWTGVSMESAEGSGELWAQLTPGAAGPGNLLAGFWQPATGKREELAV